MSMSEWMCRYVRKTKKVSWAWSQACGFWSRYPRHEYRLFTRCSWLLRGTWKCTYYSFWERIKCKRDKSVYFSFFSVKEEKKIKIADIPRYKNAKKKIKLVIPCGRVARFKRVFHWILKFASWVPRCHLPRWLNYF